MKNIEDTYKNMSEPEKQKLQKQFHESELNYLASYAFESGTLSDTDLEELNGRIDKRVNKSWPGFNMNVFVALITGIFIGSSIFFVWYEKSKTHASHYEDLNEKQAATNNEPIVLNSETKTPEQTKTIKEHFSISESGEQLNTFAQMENAEIKEINAIEVKETPLSNEETLDYIPNAPVIFVHDLKVANYKTYYFKDNRSIDVRENGLSAQFSNKEEKENTLNHRVQDRQYYAHEIIKDAMQAFHKKQYTVSVDLLELLYKYNKNDVNTQFYLGMSYYYLGNYVKAEGYLKTASENSINIFMQESEFYTALCYRNNGKVWESGELFKQIAKQKLFYAKRAQEELAKQD